jgi:multidrug transporter EmrE-like cation transporter
LVTSPWFIAGLAFYGMSLLLFTKALERMKISVAYPAQAGLAFGLITLAGALFLATIALMQYWVPAITSTAGAFTLVGGTSMLIVVQVALDTMRAIEAQLLMRNYEGFIK